MGLSDAFRAINSSNSGLITCSEIYGGLDFFGIPFTPEQVYGLMRKMSIHNEGLLSYEDFRAALTESDNAEDEEDQDDTMTASMFFNIKSSDSGSNLAGMGNMDV